MKRGRPALRGSFRDAIGDILQTYPYPLTVRSIQMQLRQSGRRAGSWHTVKKYAEELVRDGTIVRQVLPAQARYKPLVVYLARNPRPLSGGNFCKDL